MKLAWSPQLPGLAPLPFSRRPNIRNLFQVLVKIQKHLLKELDGTLPVSMLSRLRQCYGECRDYNPERESCA